MQQHHPHVPDEYRRHKSPPTPRARPCGPCPGYLSQLLGPISYSCGSTAPTGCGTCGSTSCTYSGPSAQHRGLFHPHLPLISSPTPLPPATLSPTPTTPHLSPFSARLAQSHHPFLAPSLATSPLFHDNPITTTTTMPPYPSYHNATTTIPHHHIFPPNNCRPETTSTPFQQCNHIHQHTIQITTTHNTNPTYITITKHPPGLGPGSRNRPSLCSRWMFCCMFCRASAGVGASVPRPHATSP